MSSAELNTTLHAQEECGVFGIYGPELPVAELTYLGLLAIQHRGQDAAGVAVGFKDAVEIVKDLGKVEQALNFGQSITGLEEGRVASGHVRYSTNRTATLAEKFRAAQPMYGSAALINFAVSHNGHLNNFEQTRSQANYSADNCVTDSELITHFIAEELFLGQSLDKAVESAVTRLDGAFTLVVMGSDQIIGVRDPKGFRPLVMGSIGDSGKVLASERSALDIIGADFDRDIEAGEVVRIDNTGVSSSIPFETSEIEQRLCAMEFIYFSRPDSNLLGENVEIVRIRMGQRLAAESPVAADIVVGAPNSGMSAATGYSRQSDVPIEQGLVKNNYVGRSFIIPGQNEREQAVRIKLNANREVVEGKRVVVVDDSIVRGTTTREMVRMLREAGATEVHLRISSPPYEWPCIYGMDTGDRSKLIAAQMSVSDIERELEADSLAYLSLAGLKASIGGTACKQLCDACFTGDYPTPVEFGKTRTR